MRAYLKGILILLAIAFFWGLPGARSAAAGTNIVILKSDNLTSTKRSLHGIKKVINRKHTDIDYSEYLVNESPGRDLLMIDSVRAQEPSLIVTLGTSATKLAQENFTDIPIVFSSVMYPALSGFVESLAQPGRNITGASLNIPVDVQFRTFHDIVPNLKNIGVLYSKHTARLIKPAQAIAAKMGMTLTAVLISESKELPGALDSLASTMDGIWSVADPELFTPQSTRYILLNTLRKGVPFMGFSRHVVESGALFALDFDYKAVGQQAGAIASRVIGGEPPGEISVSMVDVLWFHYNEKTAKHISVAIPSELIAVAKEVYR